MPLDQTQLSTGLAPPSAAIAAAAGATGPQIPQPGDVTAALALPNAGPSAPIAQAAGIPPPAGVSPNDPLQGVMDHINSGETGHDPDAYHALYGGGHFGFPQWSGAPGPAGMTHAAGRGQWEPATWDDAVRFWMSQNPGKPAPNFNNPADQDKVQRLWAIKTYGVDKNGRTLSQAAATGQVDYSRLAGQWPSLGHPGGASGYQEQKAAITAQQQELSQKIAGIADKIGSLDARSPEALKELAHYREQMESYMQQSLQLATHPPQFNPGQSMAQQGGMAMIIGMLGGLLTKRPMIAALNAGAAAMNAYNKNDHEAYQQNIDRWKAATDAMFKMAEFEHQMYADTLKDEQLTEGQKLDKLKAQANLLGDQRMILAAESGNLDAVQQQSLAYQKMVQQAADRQRELDIQQQRADAYSKKVEGGGAKFGTVDDLMNRWHDDFVTKNNREPTTKEIAEARGELAAETKPGAGRQEATQINAMVGSTNEAVGDLNNLMELPSRATAGLFMGVQTESPSDLAEAVRRSFASYVTDAESKDLLVSAQGIQRELATIEAQGRATGLVGLTKMADTLIPQAGDPGPVVLRKYAQIRQIIERNIETIISRTNVDQKQKELLERNRDEIKKAVPFTVHDVNELERRLDSGDDMSVAEYAKKAFGAGGGSQPAMPKVGDVREGYRFKGGDPADPNSWEKQ